VNAAGRNGDERESATQAQPTILLVEDEVLLRLALADDLRAAGLHVIEAADAEEALNVLASRTPIDVLVTDIHMPGRLDGVGLVRRVKAQHPRIKVIVASAYESDDPVSRMVDAYFRKPFDFNEVRERIRALISR
jgi:DNA-binding response OmpR family regulator